MHHSPTGNPCNKTPFLFPFPELPNENSFFLCDNRPSHCCQNQTIQYHNIRIYSVLYKLINKFLPRHVGSPLYICEFIITCKNYQVNISLPLRVKIHLRVSELLIPFGCIYGGDKDSFYLDTSIKHRFVVIISALNQKFHNQRTFCHFSSLLYQMLFYRM